MSVLECEILFFRAINVYCQYLQATVFFSCKETAKPKGMERQIQIVK